MLWSVNSSPEFNACHVVFWVASRLNILEACLCCASLFCIAPVQHDHIAPYFQLVSFFREHWLAAEIQREIRTVLCWGWGLYKSGPIFCMFLGFHLPERWVSIPSFAVRWLRWLLVCYWKRASIVQSSKSFKGQLPSRGGISYSLWSWSGWASVKPHGMPTFNKGTMPPRGENLCRHCQKAARNSTITPKQPPRGNSAIALVWRSATV